MNLINKQNHLAFRCLGFIHQILQSLLKLAAKRRAGQHRTHVNAANTATLQRIRLIFINDVLRQTFHNRSLAYASIADQHRIVLRATHQRLNHSTYLEVTTDDRIKPTGSSHLCQVDRILRQRTFVGSLIIPCRMRITSTLLVSYVKALGRNLVLRQNPNQTTVRLLDDRDQEVINRDVAVAESVVPDVPGLMQNVVDARSQENLTLRHTNRRRRRNPINQTYDVLAQSLNVNAQVT